MTSLRTRATLDNRNGTSSGKVVYRNQKLCRKQIELEHNAGLTVKVSTEENKIVGSSPGPRY